MLHLMCSLSLAALACSGATAPSTPSVASVPRKIMMVSDYDSNTPFLTDVPKVPKALRSLWNALKTLRTILQNVRVCNDDSTRQTVSHSLKPT